MPDCGNFKFPSAGLFKTLTGGDPITIEKKGQQAYTALLNCKFLFTSNELPSLSSEKSDKRRAIFCRMADGDRVVWSADFEDRLWAEGGAFLWHCLERYRALCPNHGPIPVDNKDLAEWVSILEEPFEQVFETWFEKTDSEGDYVLPDTMQMILRGEWPGKRGTQLEFLKWLERSHKVRKKHFRLSKEEKAKKFGSDEKKHSDYEWRYVTIKKIRSTVFS
jgi:hypothetical protein